jgi:hypothetical protein
MPNQIVPSVSFSLPDDNQQDIHTVAERFLRDHLAKTGSKCEPVRSVVPRSACAVESKIAAEGFLRQHLATRQTETKRYEIDESQPMILSRSTTRLAPYFYGFKNGLPVFTHERRLAQIVDSKNANELQSALRERGVDVTVLPAPETRTGSF